MLPENLWGQGKWLIRSDTLFLYPEKYEEKSVEYYYSYNPNSDKVTIKAYDKRDSSGLYFVKLYLNGSKTPMDSAKPGVFIAQESVIHDLQLHYLSTKLSVDTSKEKANELIIYWDFTKNQPMAELPTMWKAKGRYLIALADPKRKLIKKR